MFTKHLRLAWRHLWRNKLTTTLNIVGLSVGIAACMVVYNLVRYEFSFDRNVPDSERIYRVVSKLRFVDHYYHNPGVAVPVINAVRAESPTVAVTVPILNGDFSTVDVIQPGKQVMQLIPHPDDYDWVTFTDQAYFKVFPYRWLAGSPDVSLAKPGQIVLTEKEARLYFGSADPSLIGRQLIGRSYRDTLQLSVSGIVADLDAPSDFNFRAFVSLPTITTRKKARDSWSFDEWNSTNSSSQCLVKLIPTANPDRMSSRLIKLAEQHREAGAERNSRQLLLQPLADVHFDADYGNGKHTASRSTLLATAGLGLLLLVLACVNFINLATAQSTQRLKEIGVRKTLGSGRAELLGQFLGETFLLTVLATGLALSLLPIIINYLKDVLPTGVDVRWSSPAMYGFLLLVMGSTTLLAGLYPGLLITRLSVATTLRSKTTGNQETAFLRKTLIVGQFLIAQVAIIGAIIIGRQLDYLLHTDLGFRRDAIVSFLTPFNLDKAATSKRILLSNQLRGLTGVERVSLSTQLPIEAGYSTSTIEFAGKTGITKLNVYRKDGDTAYLPLYNLELLAGRNWTASDTVREFVVNETLTRKLGFARADQAIGQRINYGDRQLPIVGVVRDFHHRSLRTAIEPTILMSGENYFPRFNIQLKPGDAQTHQQTLKQIQMRWKKIYPHDLFSAKFLDESIAEIYGTEQNMSRLVSLATSVAILIACLGIFGLATFSAQQRTKEIGVRKVLGASVASIVTLLSKDFLKLVLIAIIIASPIAYYAMNRWLSNFAYRIDIPWWIFALAGVLAVGIALLTISFRSVKAALMNPVKSLRSE